MKHEKILWWILGLALVAIVGLAAYRAFFPPAPDDTASINLKPVPAVTVPIPDCVKNNTPCPKG